MNTKIPETIPTEDTLLVAISYSGGKDVGVLIVGRKKEGGVVDIINAFQGEEGVELYKKLVTKRSEDEK